MLHDSHIYSTTRNCRQTAILQDKINGKTSFIQAYIGSLTVSCNRSPNFRFVDGPTRSSPSSCALLHQDRSGGTHSGLIKQAYSSWVMLSPNSKPRKWHLTAYFTYVDLPSLPTIDRDSILSRIMVPPGIYRGGGKSRSKGDDDDMESPPSSPTALTRANSYTGAQSAVLPSLQSTVGSYAMHSRSVYPQPGGRMSEDYRVIHMLNSRHVS